MDKQALGTQTASDPIDCVRHIQQAINQHSLEALTECFHPDYQSQFPGHLDRSFSGTDQMRQNWTQIFAGVPDIQAKLLGATADGDTVWAEWEWIGTRRDGARHWQRGVTIQGVQHGQVKWVRLYMEPVQDAEAGAGTNAAVRQSLAGRESP